MTARRRRPASALLFRRLFLSLVAAIVVFGTAGDAAMGLLKGEGGCRLVKIVDGDTVTLWCGGENVERARLTGFDTPEIFSPSCLSEWWTGMRAVYALRGRLWSARRIAVRTHGRDRYGRVLADLAADGKPVGDTLVARGLARDYDGGRREGWCG